MDISDIIGETISNILVDELSIKIFFKSQNSEVEIRLIDNHLQFIGKMPKQIITYEDASYDLNTGKQI